MNLSNMLHNSLYYNHSYVYYFVAELICRNQALVYGRGKSPFSWKTTSCNQHWKVANSFDSELEWVLISTYLMYYNLTYIISVRV